MTRLQMKIMMEGFIKEYEAKEKFINLLGWEEAREDVAKIIDMVEDLELFWDRDGKLTETDWIAEIFEEVENAGGEINEEIER